MEKIKHTESDGSVKEYRVVDSFDEEKARRARELKILEREAIARGVEPFSVDGALKYYYPDELTDDEEEIRESVEGLRYDYYYSGAMSMEEWAKEREEYDVNKDSTGSE